MIFQQMPGASTDENFKRLVADLNRFHPPISRLPVFADNDAAKAAGLRANYDGYIDANGFVRRVI